MPTSSTETIIFNCDTNKCPPKKASVYPIFLTPSFSRPLGAILLFLARSHPEGRLLPTDPAGEARCLEWLSWISVDLHGIGYGQLWRPHRFVPDAALHEAVKTKGMENIQAAYDHIDRILSDGRGWAVPGQYTIVDAYLVVFWLWGRRIGLDMDTDWPNWARPMSKVLERRAVKQALMQEGTA